MTLVFNIAMDMNPALLGIVLMLWRICDVVAGSGGGGHLRQRQDAFGVAQAPFDEDKVCA